MGGQSTKRQSLPGGPLTGRRGRFASSRKGSDTAARMSRQASIASRYIRSRSTSLRSRTHSGRRRPPARLGAAGRSPLPVSVPRRSPAPGTAPSRSGCRAGRSCAGPSPRRLASCRRLRFVRRRTAQRCRRRACGAGSRGRTRWSPGLQGHSAVRRGRRRPIYGQPEPIG